MTNHGKPIKNVKNQVFVSTLHTNFSLLMKKKFQKIWFFLKLEMIIYILEKMHLKPMSGLLEITCAKMTKTNFENFSHLFHPNLEMHNFLHTTPNCKKLGLLKCALHELPNNSKNAKIRTQDKPSNKYAKMVLYVTSQSNCMINFIDLYTYYYPNYFKCIRL